MITKLKKDNFLLKDSEVKTESKVIYVGTQLSVKIAINITSIKGNPSFTFGLGNTTSSSNVEPIIKADGVNIPNNFKILASGVMVLEIDVADYSYLFIKSNIDDDNNWYGTINIFNRDYNSNLQKTYHIVELTNQYSDLEFSIEGLATEATTFLNLVFTDDFQEFINKEFVIDSQYTNGRYAKLTNGSHHAYTKKTHKYAVISNRDVSDVSITPIGDRIVIDFDSALNVLNNLTLAVRYFYPTKKYARVEFKETNYIDAGKEISFRFTENVSFLNLDGSAIMVESEPDRFFFSTNLVGGGFIVYSENGIDYTPFNFTSEDVIKFRIILSDNIITDKDEVIEDNGSYVLKRTKRELSKKCDVWGNDVVEYNSSSTIITYYKNGYHGMKCEIDVRQFLKEEESIKMCYLMPYNPTNVSNAYAVSNFSHPNRLIVFTNKGRILHNLTPTQPGRVHNILTFYESAVYDSSYIYVNDKSLVDSRHKYVPFLVDYNYNQLDNRPDIAELDGVGGKYIYRSLQEDAYTSLVTNMARSEDGAMFGNYALDELQEGFVMTSIDGGYRWTILQKMWASDYYPNNAKGNKVDFRYLGTYESGKLKVRRLYINPYISDRNNVEKQFVFNEETDAEIVSMEFGAEGTMRLTLGKNVSDVYDNFYKPIVFQNVDDDSYWSDITNNSIGEYYGERFNSNRLIFRAKLVSGTTNQLDVWFNIGNNFTTLFYGRHIHSVNRYAEGFVISTGESKKDFDKSEGGDIYLYVSPTKNGGNSLTESEQCLFKLTNAERAVNRACGAYLKGNTLYYCSDQASESCARMKYPIEGRDIYFTPVGVYKINISDVNDVDKSEQICDIGKVCLGMLVHRDKFIVQGYDCDMVVSDGGDKWHILPIEINSNNKITGTDNRGNMYYSDKKVEWKNNICNIIR